MNGPIVVGTDGSDSAMTAVVEAIALAKGLDRPLHIVSGFKPLPVSSGVPPEFDGAVGALSQVEAVLADAAARARMDGVTAETHAVEGDPADALCRTAERLSASVIVVGNRGLNSVKRFVLGSVPSKVVHNSPCSTHIVRTT
jgi:nucleotide-binding universal stress UspA family protein